MKTVRIYTQQEVVAKMLDFMHENQCSQRDLAFEANVTESFVSHVLAGRRAPNRSILDCLGFVKINAYEALADMDTQPPPE